MTWSVDTSVHVGGVTISAVAMQNCSLRAYGSRLFGCGKKTPVLVLMKTNSVISGFDLEGNTVDLADIERRFPGAISAFESV